MSVYTWLRLQRSRRQLSLGRGGEPADSVQCSTVLYTAVLHCPLSSPHTSLFPLPAPAAEDRKRCQRGRGAAIRGQPRPGESPSLFLWSKLPQLTLTASLSSETDRRAIKVICKTLRNRLWCHTSLEVVQTYIYFHIFCVFVVTKQSKLLISIHG